MIERSTWRAKLNPLPHLAVLVGLPLLISIAAIAGLPFSRPMPDYWSDANQLATTGRITQHFEPSGYAAFLAAGIKLGGRRPEFGVEVLQTLLAMLTVLIAWALMRRLGASQLAALTGACVIALHPELVVTVTKVWDVTLSTTLLLLIVFPAIQIMQDGLRWTHVLFLAVAFPAGCFDRPNYLLLAAPLAFCLLQAGQGDTVHASGRSRRGTAVLGAAVSLLAGTVAVYAALSFAVYRDLVVPANGPYNLYAGQNPFSERALLEHLNAEPALAAALHADRTAPALDVHSLAIRPYFMHASAAFAEHNGVEEARLVVVKAYTLLRADTKLHKVTSPAGFVKLLLTLPIPIWLAAIWRFRSAGGLWTQSDTLVVLVVIVYVVPFLITNSDPRFRTPLDILVLIHFFGLWSRHPVSKFVPEAA